MNTNQARAKQSEVKTVSAFGRNNKQTRIEKTPGQGIVIESRSVTESEWVIHWGAHSIRIQVAQKDLNPFRFWLVLIFLQN